MAGTTSSDAKVAAVRAADADAVINYGKDCAFLDALLSLTNGQGVDLALDAVGAATLATTVKALAKGGCLLWFGSGPPPAIDPRQLVPKCLRIAGGALFAYIGDPAELQRRAGIVVDANRSGWLRLGEGTAYPLSKVADAHRDIEGRGTRGELYLTPG